MAFFLPDQTSFVFYYLIFSRAKQKNKKQKMDLFNTSARNIIPVKLCSEFPTNVHSVGLWNKSEAWKVNFTLPFDINFTLPLQNFTMPVLEVEMLSIFCVTQISNFFLKMVGLPMFVAELLVSFNTSTLLLFFFQYYFRCTPFVYLL